jgi:osmotically-inducible protein OsmY
MFLLFIAVVREYLFQFFIRGRSDALLIPVYRFQLLHYSARPKPGSATMKMKHHELKHPCLWLGLWLLFCTLPAATAETPDKACTDPCLQAAIAALYIRSPFLSPFLIDIKVQNSVATLEGIVADAGERSLAEEIATGVDGITAVLNHIRVEPSASAQRPVKPPLDCVTHDDALADRVRTQLYWNRTTHGMAVEVSARDGVITLRGQATDRHQADLARLITLNTCGVKQVDSRIQTVTKP